MQVPVTKYMQKKGSWRTPLPPPPVLCTYLYNYCTHSCTKVMLLFQIQLQYWYNFPYNDELNKQLERYCK
jgi:hypothetical protein